MHENIFNPEYFMSGEEAQYLFEQIETLYKDYALFESRDKKRNAISVTRDLLEQCDISGNRFARFTNACQLFDYVILGDGLCLIIEHQKFKATVIGKLQECIMYMSAKKDINRMNILIEYYNALYFLLGNTASLAPFFT